MCVKQKGPVMHFLLNANCRKFEAEEEEERREVALRLVFIVFDFNC